MRSVRREVRDTHVQMADAPLDETDNKRPSLSRAEVVSFAVIGLFVIAVMAVLYVARAFFLPTMTALVVGTMLSPAARFLERYRIPRSVSAILIVGATWAGLAFMLALISAPVMEWTTRLPELLPRLKDKFHIFDKPLALWQQLQGMFGSTSAAGASGFTFPKIEWVQPTLEFLSPTFTELMLFFAVLVLFIVSWPDLRRALVMNFTGREQRLRTLRILNAIESNLGNYLLTVTIINMGLGIATGTICAITGMPNPAGLGALAAVLNYIPIIGPVATFVVLAAVGIISFPTLAAGLVPAALFALTAFIEGHFMTPTIIGRRLELNALAVIIALAFWTWLWGPMGAFLSSPILIVGLILKEHLMPEREPTLPGL